MSCVMALQALLSATLSYLADHDGYEKYPYMLPALLQAEAILQIENARGAAISLGHICENCGQVCPRKEVTR